MPTITINAHVGTAIDVTWSAAVEDGVEEFREGVGRLRKVDETAFELVWREQETFELKIFLNTPKDFDADPTVDVGVRLTENVTAHDIGFDLDTSFELQQLSVQRYDPECANSVCTEEGLNATLTASVDTSLHEFPIEVEYGLSFANGSDVNSGVNYEGLRCFMRAVDSEGQNLVLYNMDGLGPRAGGPESLHMDFDFPAVFNGTIGARVNWGLADKSAGEDFGLLVDVTQGEDLLLYFSETIRSGSATIVSATSLVKVCDPGPNAASDAPAVRGEINWEAAENVWVDIQARVYCEEGAHSRQVVHLREFMKDGEIFWSMSLPDLFDKALNVASGWDLENWGTYTGQFDRKTVATIGGWGDPENFKYDPSPSLHSGDEKLWSSLVSFCEEKFTATLQIPDAFCWRGRLDDRVGGRAARLRCCTRPFCGGLQRRRHPHEGDNCSP